MVEYTIGPVHILTSLYMQISIRYDPKIQKARYQYYTHTLRSGTFQKMRFYVLPSLPRRGKYRSRVIFLPYVDSYMKNFMKFSRYDTISRVPLETQSDIETKISTIYERIKRRLDCNIRTADETLSPFLNALSSELAIPSQTSLLVTPQICGSIGYYRSEENSVEIYPRYDFSTNGLIRLMTTALIVHLESTIPQKKRPLYSPTIEDRVTSILVSPTLRNFVETKSMETNFKGIHNILTSRHKAKYAKETTLYLDSIGIPQKTLIPEDSMKKSLTTQEKNILTQLEKNRNHITTFEEIGKAMWGNNWAKNYSLYAISKAIQRLCKKLHKNGFPTEVIHTERKKGYMLNN